MKGARIRLAGALVAATLTVGCAHVPPAGDAAARTWVPSKADPWEGLNRRIFAFNEAVDEAVLAPVARAYRAVLPAPVREGIGNVLGNAGDVWAAANHLLQGKPKAAADTGMRVGVNTVFGLLGVVDVATELGLERQSEDFGQTLGRWGLGSGPYLVLPLLGPSSVRDGAGLVVDRQFDISQLPSHERDSYAVTALEVVHKRAGLLSAGQLLGQIALDRYTFVREAYLAKRRNDVYDGNPPELPDDDPPEETPAKP